MPVTSPSAKGRNSGLQQTFGQAREGRVSCSQAMAVDAHTVKQQRAILTILLANCQRALEAFQAADNVADESFVDDLERIIARTKTELDALREA